MASIGFSGILDFVRTRGDEATNDLEVYFTRYTGRWFEHFSALSKPLHLDANDFAACAALSVELDGKTVDGLMRRVDEIDSLLARCPDRSVSLSQIDPAGGSYLALSNLYDLLRDVPGMGPARASKLLACKRPHLVPIRDSVVESLLGAGSEWWGPWREVVSIPEVVDLVGRLSADVAPTETSMLRRLDIILWMYGSRTQPSQA